jgi:hypothetical protein
VSGLTAATSARSDAGLATFLAVVLAAFAWGFYHASKGAPPLQSEKPAGKTRPALGRAVFWVIADIVGVVIFVVLMFAVFGVDWRPALSRFIWLGGNMPECDSGVATSLLKEAINTSPSAKTLGVEALDVTDAHTLVDSSSDHRHCEATVFANNGKRRVAFTIEWIDREHTKVWLQTEN